MTVMAGAANFFSATIFAIFPNLPSIDCCRPVVPQRTIPTGVSADMPCFISWSATWPIRSTPISTTFVPGIFASRSKSSELPSLEGSSCPVITVKLEE